MQASRHIYPITPAADESEYIEENQILELESNGRRIVVIQTEDEIAAITMRLALRSQARGSATKHSGPSGFSLMVKVWDGRHK